MELKISLLLASYFLLLPFAFAIDASNRYRSPRNPERKVRQSTSLIVLHTTEAPAKSSLNKVSDRGECHYCVTEDGSVYAIVDRDREAFHAGRSMWRGKEDVDTFSVGIECVGYHDKPMAGVQIAAIAKLVKELQVMYRIPDECVVCHSHVAYGAPNKWHRGKHRGRKRCGMLFAMPSIRQRIGLKARPAYDPDVRAKRLVQADPYLAKVLYGSVDTMRGTAAPATAGTSAGSVLGWLGRKAGLTREAPKESISAKPKPAGKGKKPKAKAPTSVAELKASGYRLAGVVSKGASAMKIAGKRWNAPDTYYTIRNKVLPGNTLDDARIEKGMSVWMK